MPPAVANQKKKDEKQTNYDHFKSLEFPCFDSNNVQWFMFYVR